MTLESVWRDIPAIKPATEARPGPDWNQALTGASLLSQIPIEQAQEAALRIAQGALVGDTTTKDQEDAASLLLERMGNRLAIELAAKRDGATPPTDDAWLAAPGPLSLDVLRRRLELAIPMAGDLPALDGNPFQRELWTLLETARWISASAPTSAGKSYIVKRWFEERIRRAERFRGVYVVPTRALIEEVSRELRTLLPKEVGVYSIPWDKDVDSGDHEVYVLTQERLHFLHELVPTFKADLLFIDEAQKLGDSQRGVLLQRVLSDSLIRNGDLQVVFASPLASNPESLLEGGPAELSESVTAETVTVNQNLLWVDQVFGKPKVWTATVVDGDRELEAGIFELQDRPVSQGKRLSYVAVALGRDASGNVVYVNGAAAAEKTAAQIADALGPDADISTTDEIEALVELVENTIHRSYALIGVLRRGVAFHYGNMPLLVRREIEDLFRSGTLRYLVCTSTLLEGVNLPCRNIFARAAKKGSAPMSSADFWNLAGRAGRWGKEFEGNIICVDAKSENVWATPPRRRTRTALTRATQPAFDDLSVLKSFVEAGAPIEEARENRLLEDVYSLLASRILGGHDLSALPNLKAAPQEVEDLEASISKSLDETELATDVVRRHAGISPPAMQRLLEYIRGHEDQDAMLLVQPESADAAVNYKRALSRCNNNLGASFGSNARQFQLAILIVEWMRGRRLAYLISKRIEINTKRNDKSIARDIRAVMSDIDEVARFAAPKYLACYRDVLTFHLEQTDRADQIAELPDVAMMLELGVARTTEVSMMTLGLSRPSVVELEPRIAQDELTPDECVTWLREANLESFGLPRLVEREINEVLEKLAVE